MNHKRGKPKASRSACLLCKPWKAMGNMKVAMRIQRLRSIDEFKEEMYRNFYK